MNLSFKSSSYSRKIFGFRLSGRGFMIFLDWGELLPASEIDPTSCSCSTFFSSEGAFLTFGVFRISASASAVSSEVTLFKSLIVTLALFLSLFLAVWEFFLKSPKESINFDNSLGRLP